MIKFKGPVQELEVNNYQTKQPAQELELKTRSKAWSQYAAIKILLS